MRPPTTEDGSPSRTLEFSRLLSSFSWVVTANLARQVAFLIVNIVLFERLSNSQFGAVALAFGYMQVFAGLGEFGIRQIGWREVARHPERAVELTGSFLVAKGITGALSTALYLALFPWLWSDPSTRWVYLTYGLGIVINGGTFDFPLYGLQRIDLFAKFSLVAFGFYLVTCLLFVQKDDHAWLVPVLFAASMALLCGLELRWFWSTQGYFNLHIDRRAFSATLRQSWPLGVGETLNRLALGYPVLLIGWCIGSEGVGHYRIVELCYSFLAQFGHMFAAAVFSRVSRLFRSQHLGLRRELSIMLLLLVSAALLFSGTTILAGPAAYQLGFDHINAESLTALRYLGLALAFATPVRFLKGLLSSLDQQTTLPVVNVVSLGLGGAIGWVLLQSQGIVGMAIAVVISEATTLILLLAKYWRSLRHPGAAADRRKDPVAS
jgi:O-antigen/teichoic acid export membrane protein